jgi:hypothetical protein
MSETRRPRPLVLIALCALVLAGFALRWLGVGWGLPHQTYRDGMVISTQVEYLREMPEDPTANEFWGYYPHLMSRLILLAPDDWVGEPREPLELEGHLARASEPWLMARQLSVLLSLLAIPGAFFVARRFVSDGWALFAAALVTFSLLHLSFAQQEKPHGPVSGTVVMAVLAAMALARKPGAWTWFVATAAMALALATAVNGAFALVSAAAALFAMFLGRSERGGLWKLIARAIVPTLLVLAATVRFFYPFLFGGGEKEKLGDHALNVGNHPLMLDKLNFAGSKNMFLTLYLYEPVLLVLGIVGVGVFLWRCKSRGPVDLERRRDLAVILPFAVMYGLFVCVYEDAFDRFLMPLVPFLAALAAYAAAALSSRIRSKPALVAVAALLLAEPAAATVALARVRARPDTQTQVAEWIRAHVQPEERVVVLPYIDLPLFYSEAAVAESPDASEVLTWMAYQARLDSKWKLGPSYTVLPPRGVKQEFAELGDAPLDGIRARGADYVVIQAFGERYRYKVLLRLLEELREKAERVFVAAPRADGEESGRVWIREKMTLNQVPTWLRVFQDRSMGTVLEIYRVPKESAR